MGYARRKLAYQPPLQQSFRPRASHMAHVALPPPSEVGTKGYYFNTLLLAPSATAQSRPRVPTNARVAAARPDNSAAAAPTQDPPASAIKCSRGPGRLPYTVRIATDIQGCLHHPGQAASRAHQARRRPATLKP